MAQSKKTSEEAAAAAITGGGQTILRAVQAGSNVKLTDDQLRAWSQTFPATQNPSADANTLDDYEEGTFTPAFTAATPPSSVTYATQSGFYTKVGRLVTFELRVTLTSKGSGGVGLIALTGLPFTVADRSAACAFIYDNVNLNTGFTSAQASANQNLTTLAIVELGDNVAAAGVTWANVANNTDFQIAGHYHV